MLPDLGLGGSQRFVLNTLKILEDSNKVKGHLFVARSDVSMNLEGIHAPIYFGSGRTRSSLTRLVRVINEVKPDIVFTVLDRSAFLAAIAKIVCLRHSFDMIVRKSNMPLFHNELGISLFVRIGLKGVHLLAKEIVAQNSQMRDQLISKDNKLVSKCKILHNPVEPELHELSKGGRLKNYGDYFIALGRVSEQKNYEFLIEAFASYYKKSQSDCNLLIIGNLDDGKYVICTELCKRLNLSNRVFFLGEMANPFPYLKHSLALVSSSKYEGFPNAVIEALSLNKRVIVSNVLDIYNDILNKEEDIICELSVAAFAEAFEKVYQDGYGEKRGRINVNFNKKLLSYFEQL